MVQPEIYNTLHTLSGFFECNFPCALFFSRFFQFRYPPSGRQILRRNIGHIPSSANAGTADSLNGSVNLDARFPGQWYQLETGLHYNWHRHYDPTLGRYTQPDPVGMPDGPNRFAYARSNPMMKIDPDGRQVALPMPGPGIPLPLPPVFIPGSPENEQFTKNTLGGLQKIIQLCRRSLGFGGGNDNDEPDCHDRYEREMQSCHKRRWKMAHPHYFNGCLDRAADRRSQCIRNGGRPAPGELSEWSDADEETWINPFK
jgi:RHS repeat-associated protein